MNGFVCWVSLENSEIAVAQVKQIQQNENFKKYMGGRFIKIIIALIAFYSLLFIGILLFTGAGFIDLAQIQYEDLKVHFIVISICVFLMILIYESL